MSIKSITRTIQWYGLLRFPELQQGERIHWWRLIVDMQRRPTGEYRNDGVWQPPRGFWGNVCLRRDKRVLKSSQLEFQNQIVMMEVYTEAFLHQCISCHLDATLKSFENLANALDLPVISRVNPIRDWKPYTLIPTDFSIKMIAENAIARFTLEYDIIQICSVDGTTPPEPPPPPLPPSELPPLPPNQSFEDPISDAYDGDKDGGETYDPDPFSEYPDFPIGGDCKVYKITILYWLVGEDPQSAGSEAFAFFYSPIENIFLGKFEEQDQSNSVVVISAGRIDIQDCEPGQRSTIAAYNVASFEILSIEEV